MSSVKLTADSGGGTVELKAPATTTSNGAKVITLSYWSFVIYLPRVPNRTSNSL